ncbi:cyclic nucleotide-binding domain-containing protein [bacterium]|nr:cyclic nucleotide-binding domain-containing protein [bacterium]
MIDELKNSSLFADFSRDELNAVERIIKRETITAGDYAFREGEKGDSLIIIRMGTLKLTKIDKGGDAKDLATLSSGAYVGEMAMFDEGLRSASGIATERTEILILPYKELRNLLSNHVAMAAKFYERLASGISHRLNYLNHDFLSLKRFLKPRD